MSLDRLQNVVRGLPYNLRDQVIGYARSVDAAAPDIAREADVELSRDLRDRLVFLAGVRKLYAICASTYWAVDNATAFLGRQDISSVRVGRTDYSRGGEIHAGLRALYRDFEAILGQYDLQAVVDGSFPDLLILLAHER
jgi:hypothetical protein